VFYCRCNGVPSFIYSIIKRVFFNESEVVGEKISKVILSLNFDYPVSIAITPLLIYSKRNELSKTRVGTKEYYETKD
jgi:hypothetical protein